MTALSCRCSRLATRNERRSWRCCSTLRPSRGSSTHVTLPACGTVVISPRIAPTLGAKRALPICLWFRPRMASTSSWRRTASAWSISSWRQESRRPPGPPTIRKFLRRPRGGAVPGLFSPSGSGNFFLQSHADEVGATFSRTIQLSCADVIRVHGPSIAVGVAVMTSPVVRR